MPMIDSISMSLLAGIAFLGGALVPVCRLLTITRSNQLRRAWLYLAIMITGFIIGYMALIGLLPRDSNRVLVNLICVVLVMGGVFVLSVSILALQTAADLSKLVHLEKEIVVDALTGAYNRRFFEETFDREIAHAKRTGTDISLLVIDLDHFKAVNDTHGHAVGDRVLSVVAAVLNDGVRASDMVVRYGGEEFVVIAPITGQSAVELLAERLRRMVAETQISCAGGLKLSVTVSIGTATLRDDDSCEALFTRADTAVYDAKRHGRNCVWSGDPVKPRADRISDAA